MQIVWNPFATNLEQSEPSVMTSIMLKYKLHYLNGVGKGWNQVSIAVRHHWRHLLWLYIPVSTGQKKIITEVMGSVTDNKLNLTEVLSFHYYYKIDVVFFPSGEIFLHFLSF